MGVQTLQLKMMVRMIIPLLVSWITVAIAAESGSSCCVEKEVGTIKYKLVKEDMEETSKFGCQDGCIYEYEDLPGKIWCFKAGSEPTTCLDSEFHWCYEGDCGPDNWGKHFPDCNGKSQSPIDIVWDGSTTSPQTTPLSMSQYDKVRINVLANTEEHNELKSNNRIENGTLKNNGHTAQLDVVKLSDDVGIISGGNLNGSYQILQLHFHWGSDDTEGSEHTLNGKEYPIELHIVHVQKGNPDPLNTKGGLAVTGFFFEVSAEDNAALTPLVESLASIIESDSKVPMINSAFKISDLIKDVAPLAPGNTATPYSTYSGSLTTPGCNEVVHWINILTPLKISSAQLEAFRKLDGAKGTDIVNNYRPPLPLNGREVLFFS